MNNDNKSTVSNTRINGIPITIYNTVIDGEGFYVSYNNYDTALYGDVTTALVIGQMEHFYILYGDHRKNYIPLINKGIDACLLYFKQNINLIAKYSETI